MRCVRIRLAVLVALGAAVAASPAAHATPVTYRLTFERYWDASHVIPGRYPGASAHFTPLAGAAHDATPLWAPGESASIGIENVAEIGSTTQLELAIAARVQAGTARAYFEADAIFVGQFSSETTFSADLTHRYVSAISMIAPSPDWFVGIWGVDLAPLGVFLPELVFDLRAWDAGTETGDRFRLDNPDSDPRGVITRRLDPFVGDPVIGRITLTQIPEPATGLLVALGTFALGWRRRAQRGRLV